MSTTSAPWSPPATPHTLFTDDLIRNLRAASGDYNLRISPEIRGEALRLSYKIEVDPGSLLPVEAAWIGWLFAATAAGSVA